jgi:hypothetical protein
MNKIKLILILLLLSVFACKRHEKLESFVWIENNRNWIRNDSTKLEAIHAIYITEDFKKATVAKIKKRNGPYDFFEMTLSDTLKNLIYNNFHKIAYSEYYRQENTKRPYLYDRNIYAIIYKFSNQPERIINYIPNEAPEHLLHVINTLEGVANLEYSQIADSFPLRSIVNKYRRSMFNYFELRPPLWDPTAKYKPPVIVDTLK